MVCLVFLSYEKIPSVVLVATWLRGLVENAPTLKVEAPLVLGNEMEVKRVG